VAALPPFGGAMLLADKSAWARSDNPAVAPEWQQALADGLIITCPITVMELLYSAQSSVEFERMEEELAVLRSVAITSSVINAARAAHRELAAQSNLYHRVPLPDLLVAACAQDVGVGVLHYDTHYDRLATIMVFDSVWLAPAGSFP